MNSHRSAHASNKPLAPLPLRALLFSIFAQTPFLFAAWATPRLESVLLGAAFLVIGIVLNVWSERLFRASDAGVCPFSPVGSLVQRGPYRLSRNPMYLGIVLISAGIALAAGSLWNLSVSVTLGLYLHFWFVLPEEEFLQQRLGTPYLRYALRIPRWVGLPRRG